MRGFACRSPVQDVVTWLRGQASLLSTEVVGLSESAGRVLAADVISQVNVPNFARAMMDGYALRAADTAGSSSYNQLVLDVIDESLPGRAASGEISVGQAVRIMTGSPLPAGADSVLPAEYVQSEGDQIRVAQPTSPGKHVGQPGEDIAAGCSVLPAGRRLRPQDVGLLASIGHAQVHVVRRPRVRIVVTGNELLPPGSQPQGCCIVDSNSPMLEALIRRDGGVIDHPGILPDEPNEILRAMQADADVVLVSGGSSVGLEDHAPRILAERGELAFHGIAMRPSSPTGMGRLNGQLVFLLPGNPVSCLCAYDFFAGGVIRLLGGRHWEWPYRSARFPLARKLGSTIGRLDYARVRLIDDKIHPISIGGASILSSTSRADGFVVVPEDSEGFAEGREVEVHFYDAFIP